MIRGALSKDFEGLPSLLSRSFTFPFVPPRLANAHEYYFALMKTLARVAAADKRGAFDEVLSSFVSNTKRRTPPDNKARRLASRMWTENMVDDLVEFQRIAPSIFPPEISGPHFLKKLRRELTRCSEYFTAATNWVASDFRYTAMGHANLQVDNAFFWLSSDGKALEAGLLDWYNTTRAPFASSFLMCMSGAEPDVLSRNIRDLVDCFVCEYSNAGGPEISTEVLLLQFHLLSVQALVGSFSFIVSDIFKEGPSQDEWATVMTTNDTRVMGRWNVRCRVIAIIQQLLFWEKNDLTKIMLSWAEKECIA